jgi:tripartite-type tricarboxylate transporter receptor subunit TctC
MIWQLARGTRIAWAALIPFFATAAPVHGAAQDPSTRSGPAFPARPVRMVAAFAPGGSVDVVARLLAQKLAENWGQQVVVDNRPGAGGNVSAEIVARAPNDGHTIYICSASFVVNPSLYGKTLYDPVRDFAPVSLVSRVQNVLVAHPALPARSVKELIALAKAKPGQIYYASTGAGTSGHLVMELFKSTAGIDLVHVPYKVIGQAQADLMGGQVSLWFPTAPGALPHIQAGRMRALAVAGAKRSPALPELPTVSEAGVPGFEASTWYALLAPANTPQNIVAKLNGEVVRILKQPEVHERLTAMGIEIVGGSPDELARHIRSEIPKWARVVKQSGARVD